MRTITMTAIVVAGAAATAISLSAPAGANPNVEPCNFTFIPICSLIPVMPELDHDVDLTKDPNGPNAHAGGDLAPNATASGG